MNLGMSVSGDAQGDSRAWTWLAGEVARSARGTARTSRMNGADANDIAQWVLLTLWERAPMLRDPACLPGCLATMVRRRAGRLRRRRARECPHEPEQLPCPAETHSPELEALRADRDRALWNAVTNLPSERARTLVWLLAHHPELTQAQLAAELGLAPGTIGPLRRRCLDAMRLRLLRQGYDPSDVR